MAPHSEDSSHGDSLLTSNSVHANQISKSTTALRYSKEELLEFRATKENTGPKDTVSSVIIDKQPSVTIEDEKLDIIKLGQSLDVGHAEPQKEDEDKDFTDVVLEKKKKKKRSSGKNKNKKATPNGFEGNSLLSIFR
jgi:hypothetical protein